MVGGVDMQERSSQGKKWCRERREREVELVALARLQARLITLLPYQLRSPIDLDAQHHTAPAHIVSSPNSKHTAPTHTPRQALGRASTLCPPGGESRALLSAPRWHPNRVADTPIATLFCNASTASSRATTLGNTSSRGTALANSNLAV